MSDPALERLAGVIFATIYPYDIRAKQADVIAAYSARLAVSIRAHLVALTRRPDEAPVVPSPF